MSHFNWVDYLLLAVYLLSIFAGLARGFVREILSLITLLAAFVVAVMFSNALASMFTGSQSVQGMVDQASSSIGAEAATQGVSYVALGISFAALFIGTTIIGALISMVVNAAFQGGILGFGNRLMGGIFGLVRAYILTLVLIFVVQLTPMGEADSWQGSQMVKWYQPAVVWLTGIVAPSLTSLKEKLGQTLQNATSQIQNISNTYNHSR